MMCKTSLRSACIVVLSSSVWACATVAPVVPEPPKLTPGPHLRIAVSASEEDSRLGDELAARLEHLGSVDRVTVASVDALGEACMEEVDLAVFVSKEHRTFVSNAGERNTLIIYESAIIVGLPVAMISAAAWPWSGEITTTGELTTLWCHSGETANTAALTSIRARGYGFIGSTRLEEEMEAHTAPALASDLVRVANECGRLSQGGERCKEP